MVEGARVEPALATAKAKERHQFERKGYYFVDPKDSKDGAPVFNLIVSLRDRCEKTAAEHRRSRAGGVCASVRAQSRYSTIACKPSNSAAPADLARRSASLVETPRKVSR